jgi:hypothetical protein
MLVLWVCFLVPVPAIAMQCRSGSMQHSCSTSKIRSSADTDMLEDAISNDHISSLL